MSMTGTLEIQDGDDRTVVVFWEYEPACKGARERGTGLQMEPDFDAQVHINELRYRDTDTELEAAEYDLLEDKAEQAVWDYLEMN